MKDNIIKFLKYFLIAAAAILAILIIFGFVLVMDWPWWVGFFLLLGISGGGIGSLFLKKILLRRKEQQFVSQVIAQDEARLKAMQGKEKTEHTEIQNKWKEAVEALKQSHLKKQGNPLYVLPWYMIIGESGSGKTTALNSAKLSSPFIEVTRTSGISGTKNCDWWFFEQAIILDTAGRYAIPVDEGHDKEEWQKFLNLLVKYRKKEPLNGLIVAVSADKLLANTPETLEEDGRNIGRRIDELMRVLGTRFPVYLLVTKCDLIQGMTKFCGSLPEKSLDQPMGYINQNLSKDVTSFLETAINTIVERLRNLRLLLLHKPESREVDPGLLLFPEEFNNLKKGLDTFIRITFKENPYQETPVLRGIFFSSGRQEGTPFSHFLNALGLIGEKEVLPGTSKGLFLHDFFSNILPKDRGLLKPTRVAIEWNNLTRNLGVTAWIVIGLAICGLLSFSFVKNLRTLRGVSHEFAKLPVLQRDFPTDINSMESFNQAILNIENQNQSWWIPRFGLYESINVEKLLKDKFCYQFQQGFLAPIDKRLRENIATLSPSVSDQVYGQYVSHIVRRINLLKSRLADEELESLQSRPQPAYLSLMSSEGLEMTPAVRQKFGRMFLYYLYWRSDSSDIDKEIEILQSLLKDLMRLRGGNFRWLITWANTVSTVEPITLKDFWGGSASSEGEEIIAPAFSSKGNEAIDSMFKEIELALNDPSIREKYKSEFDAWYRINSFQAWQNFASVFYKGARRLNGMKENQPIAGRIATEEGPYFAFMNKAASDLEPIVTGESLPLWLQQVYQFQNIKTMGFAGGVVAKTSEEGMKFIDRIKAKVGRKIETPTMESQSAAVKAFQEYKNSLSAITQSATSRGQIYQLTLQAYSEDPLTGKSPFLNAQRAVSRLKTSLTGQSSTDDLFSRLLTGSLDYLWEYARMETACQLQSQWEKEVLAESQGVSGPQAVEILFGQEGLVWKFIKGPAAPLIEWKAARGYYAREVMGGSIPFNSSFISFLSGGAKAKAATLPQMQQQYYKVQISGLPIGSNPDAGVKPHKSQLELSCEGETQSLVNFNYPITKTFTWSPATCSDVMLRIEVGNTTLERHYSGPQGFINFLRDFSGGSRTFNAGDFPEDRNALKKAGIKYIRINYQFSGENAILRSAGASTGQAQSGAPRDIVTCWD